MGEVRFVDQVKHADSLTWYAGKAFYTSVVRRVVLCRGPSVLLSVRLSTFCVRYCSRYFPEIPYKYKPLSDDMQRTSTETPPTILRNYNLLNFSYENL